MGDDDSRYLSLAASREEEFSSRQDSFTFNVKCIERGAKLTRFFSRSICDRRYLPGVGGGGRKAKQNTRAKKESHTGRPQDLVQGSGLAGMAGMAGTANIPPIHSRPMDDQPDSPPNPLHHIIPHAHSTCCTLGPYIHPTTCTIYAVALFRPSLMHPAGPLGETAHTHTHDMQDNHTPTHPSRGGIPLIGYPFDLPSLPVSA